MKRRPEQLSMLSLMGGSPPERTEPFQGSVITLMEYDELGNVTRLVVEGAEHVEAKRLATQASGLVAEAGSKPAATVGPAEDPLQQGSTDGVPPW